MTKVSNDTIVAHDVAEHKTGTVILFLSFGVLVACLCRVVIKQLLKNKLPIPFTVIVLILGFIIGIIVTNFPSKNNDLLLGEKELREINPHLVYYIFLPLLIFDSAFNNKFYVIQPQIISGVLLAGPGVFITVAVVAVFGVYIFPYDWSWLVALLFGSILSATDPVAVVALLHESGASKSLAALIDLESLLNDGSAFVLFLIFQDLLVGRVHSAKKILIDIVKFTIGGPAFGLACGMLAVVIFNMIHNELQVEILSTFGLAYLVFYIADVEIGVSAVLALVVMGLFMSKNKYCVSSHVQIPMVHTWSIVIDLANILIFFITGILLAHSLIGTKATITGHDFLYSFALYIAIHIGRLLCILLYPLIRLSGVYLSWRDCTVLTWSGLRGSMSVVLALIVDSDSRIDVSTRNRFLFHICMMALLTLIVNGTSSKFLVKLLGLNHGTPESETVLQQALEHMRVKTVEQIENMKKDKQFAEVDWNLLQEYLPEKLFEEMDTGRNSHVHRQLLAELDSVACQSVLPCSIHDMLHAELKQVPTIHEISYALEDLAGRRTDSTKDSILPAVETCGTISSSNFRKELIIRILTALAVDYEKQWYRGTLRRRTLYILISSVEKAKHEHSLQLHFRLILNNLQLSKTLQRLLNLDSVHRVKRYADKRLFDHIFLTIELTLAFHTTRNRIDNIGLRFPELAKIDEKVWNEVCQEAHFYYLMATYVLLDLQRSYEGCWRMHMTKRCAQMLLKYESKTIIELYETGMLGEAEYSHILQLIEKKFVNLEFYRVKIHQVSMKEIENSFDLLELFQLLPTTDKVRWRYFMKSKHRWFQPNKVLIRKNQRVTTAYLINRGMIEQQVDQMPVFYCSGNIVGVDALFSQNSTAHDTYSAASGTLLEAYCIDSTLLHELLSDMNLAPAVYREIALHILGNNYQARLKLTRLQIKTMLFERAKFHFNQERLSIRLKEDERLLILAGSVNYISDGHTNTWKSVQLQIIDKELDYDFDPSTVAFSWTDEDEEFNIPDKCHRFQSSLDALRSVQYSVLYPGCNPNVMDSTEKQYSKTLTEDQECLDNRKEKAS